MRITKREERKNTKEKKMEIPKMEFLKFRNW